MSRKIPCVLMRGGTSKGVFLRAEDLPPPSSDRDRAILAIFGSPDPRQIDGLGGADPLTSKVAIIGPSHRDDADVEYTFGQVSIDKPEVVYINNCGNLPAAVGPYAIEAGLVEPTEPITSVRIFNTNSGKRIIAHVPVRNGRIVTTGEFRIDGVPSPGAPIRLTFCNPEGGATGKLLPTGNASDSVTLDTGQVAVSVVDCGNLYCFVAASDLGLSGKEEPAYIETRQDVTARVDVLRQAVSDRLVASGAVESSKGQSLRRSLKVATVAGSADDADVISRILNPGKVHKNFAVTGAIALAAASTVSGSVVNKLVPPTSSPDMRRVAIRHPQGVIEADIEFEQGEHCPRILAASFTRTARRIMEGFVFLPESLAG